MPSTSSPARSLPAAACYLRHGATSRVHYCSCYQQRPLTAPCKTREARRQRCRRSCRVRAPVRECVSLRRRCRGSASEPAAQVCAPTRAVRAAVPLSGKTIGGRVELRSARIKCSGGLQSGAAPSVATLTSCKRRIRQIEPSAGCSRGARSPMQLKAVRRRRGLGGPARCSSRSAGKVAIELSNCARDHSRSEWPLVMGARTQRACV